MRVDLASPIDVGDFRSRAIDLLAHQVPPADIDWHSQASLSIGCVFPDKGTGAPMPPSALHSIVPRSFVRLTELVVLHRDANRFELLYRLLWRLVHEPELAGAGGDRDMALAQSMAQAVRRDIVKVRKGLHFRPLAPLAPLADVPLAFAWCEPQHRVTEVVAEALTHTQRATAWLLASPDRAVLWTGDALLCGAGMVPMQARAMTDEQWHDLAAGLVELPLEAA